MAWLNRALSWAAGAVAFAFLMWGMGKRAARQQADFKRAEANLKAAQRAKDVRHEIETSDDQHLVNILTGKLHDKR